MCFWRGHSLCRAPLTTGVEIYPRVLPSACCVLLAGPLPLQGALNHWGIYLPQGPTICILCASRGANPFAGRPSLNHWGRYLPQGSTTCILCASGGPLPLQGALNHWGRILPQGPTIQNQRTNGPVNAHLISGPPVSTKTNQRTSGPVNAHLISLPSKAQNIQNLENIW